jgi:fatty-acyl-CoA synthase
VFASLNDAPRWWAAHTPDAVAIAVGADEVTYRELDEWVDRIAARLSDEGLGSGDRVGVVGGNCLEWVVAALATLRRGGIIAAFNHRFVAQELAGLLAQYEPSFMFAAESHMARMKEATGSQGGSLELCPFSEIAAARTGEPVRHAEPDLERDHPAIIVSTSGTTGMPKGVILTHGGILAGLLEWAVMEPGWGHRSRLLGVAPLAPFGGFCWSICSQLLWGGTVYLEPDFNPARALDVLVKKKITVLTAPVVFFEQIALEPEFAHADLSALSTASLGGSPVPVPLLQAWQRRGVLLRQIYGLTEAGGPIQVTSVQDALEHPDRCGRRGLHRKARIIRPDGTVCAPNEPGEIIVRGAAVSPGYWNAPETTREAFRDGWLHTGDLGEVDEDGLLKVAGRLKDMIISGGFNIGPAEIEHVIQRLPAVAEVAVLGVPDPKFGETPAAVVHLRDPIAVTDIIDHCNAALADYKVPRYVVISEQPLPRNQSGKIVKPDLRKQYPDIPAAFPRVR